MVPPVDPTSLVFNLVWTEGAFDYLSLFTRSLLAESTARYRMVANACSTDEIARMEAFAVEHPDGIADVVVVSESETLSHGAALDAVRRLRDDGDHFCLIDPDILATGPFVEDFLSILPPGGAVTSGKELWSDSNVLPEGHIGLNGEYFFRADGYVFGSPHFAIYDRQGLDATLERWGIGFASGSTDLPPEGQALLEAKGLAYWMFDTAKLANIMLQEDGHPLVHQEHDELVHVGGLLHYLWAPRVADADGEIDVDWARWANQGPRHQVARYAAQVLHALVDGEPAPDVPATASPELIDRLERTRDALVRTADVHGEGWAGRTPRRDLDQGVASSRFVLGRALESGG